jgi:uncharacterized protein
MLPRIFFAFKQIWHKRSSLCTYLTDKDRQINDVCLVGLEYLEKNGILALVLDYDGVLAAHGELELSASVENWLNVLCVDYQGRIYVLSNKPTLLRQNYFKRRFPRVDFVVGRRKKPYPDGLLQILEANPHLEPRQVLLVDDRLGTGMLAAELVGVQGLLVTPARSNYARRPIVEVWFEFLRYAERWLAKCLNICKMKRN